MLRGHGTEPHDLNFADTERIELELMLTRELLRSVARVDSISEALQLSLVHICAITGWAVGQAWTPNAETKRLECSSVWHSRGGRFPRFRTTSAHLTFGPGEGLPGRVWQTKGPAWIVDLGLDGNFPRLNVAGVEGLRAAMALPILSNARVVAVLEFFVTEHRPEDERLLELVSLTTAPLGLLIERKQLEQDLRASERLARYQREWEHFTHVATHDLQEPLRNISNFAQLLREQCGATLASNGLEYLSVIDTAAKRIIQIVSDLLEYSSLGESTSLRQVSIASIVTELRSTFSEPLSEPGACLICGEMPEVLGAPDQLLTLFRHLISNAIKFRGSSPARIRLKAQSGGEDWLFELSDHGIGFDPQYAEYIFGVFKRLHCAEEYPGSGIGLAICRRVVEKHGGRIWATSCPGEGTTFHFTLPKVPDGARET